jgi:hypothetical protein
MCLGSIHTGTLPGLISLEPVSVTRCANVAHLTPPPARTAATRRISRVGDMQKWEYVTVPLLSHATKQILDSWGDQGYELVSIVPGPTGEQLVAYLKRPIEAK